MSDFQTIEQNLRCAMKFFGGATGSGDVRQLAGSEAIYSGLDYGVFNIALLDGPVTQADNGLEVRIAGAARYFRDRTLRWSFWVCEDLLDHATRKRVRQSFADFGMWSISRPPGMFAPKLLPPSRPLPAIECRRVSDKPLRQAFTEITSVAFEIPQTVAFAVYSQERAWRGDYQGYVGFVDGRPVAIVAVVVAGGAIGIYSLATLPIHRRRGYGEALLRAAVEDTRATTGIEPLVLQSTEAGYELYRRMGFHDATRFSVYLTK